MDQEKDSFFLNSVLFKEDTNLETLLISSLESLA
jgi:hypothetical protein